MIAVSFAFASVLGSSAHAQIAKTTFDTTAESEALATITATCNRCAWDVAGREAVFLSISLDGRYVQDLPLVRTGRADYRVMLGRVSAGRHTIIIETDRELTSAELRDRDSVTNAQVDVDIVALRTPDATAISYAPILHARPDTVGKYTDVPVFMWYETEPTTRGTRYRYSVIFTNEDGGTPADRLMATWGRTTDIEYLYSVELDAQGKILAEDIQGPKHEILVFKGKREGLHPLLWVSTSNNMVLDEGTTRLRFAPAPVSFQLEDVSREAVMDAHPWMYGVMASELKREGKLGVDPPAGRGLIPDLRRFVIIEGCGDLSGNALAFAVNVRGQWISSDRGLKEFRIVRNGCFRAAVPLPAGAGIQDVRGIRAEVFARDDKKPATRATLTHINKVFALDDRFMPGKNFLQWKGRAELIPDGDAFELAVKR